MVRIRLSRVGSRNRPFYHIIVSDKRNSRNGKFIEKIGFFNPIYLGKSVKLNFNLNRLNYWISVGAKMSSRVKILIRKNN